MPSLPDQSLSVVDYSDRNAPEVIKDLTLARNVISAQPSLAECLEQHADAPRRRGTCK